MKWSIESLHDPAGLRELEAFTSARDVCSVFQSGVLAEAYAASPDTTPTVLVARDSGGAVRGSLLGVTFTHGLARDSPVNRLTAHTTIRGIPPIDVDESHEALAAVLLSELPPHLPAGSSYLRWYPDSETPVQLALEGQEFVREPWLNILIDLRSSERQLLAGMSKHRRKGIRAAERAGLEVTEASTREELRSLYTLLADAHHRLRIPFQRPQLFEALYDHVRPKGHALILLARQRERLVAGRVLLLYHGLAYDWYAGSTAEVRTLHVDELLAWRAMLLAKRRGAVTFDFGGAGKPDEDYGPREFKRRFGGTETDYGRYTKVLRPVRFRVMNTAQEVIRRL